MLASGPGTHSFVYPLYLDKPFAVTFTHAENSYLQVLMECGLFGGALLGVAVFAVGWWCLRHLVAKPTLGNDTVTAPAPSGLAAAYSFGVGASLLAALIQGLVDFVWYVPAYAAAIAGPPALARRLYRLPAHAGGTPSPP